MSVKVVRERSDQRRHHRVTAPLFVEVDGHRLKATDWSLGGLRVDGMPGELPALGATIGLIISLPFQGFDVRFDCDAEVVRRLKDTGTLAVKYTRIGERELGLMEHFIDELIRGTMVDVKDTIQRIDVPVTPASTKPDVNPLAKVPISRWPTRTIAFVALYLTIGLFVFGYAGVIAYTNFVRLEIDTAVIASPLESVRAQVNGRIVYGKYRQGDHVPKGALLLSVVDNDLERQIDLASIDIKDKAAQLSSFERMLVEELARVDAFARVEGKNLDQIELEVQSMEAQAKAAKALFDRLNHLYKQGFTTATLTENAEKQMIAAQKLAEAKQVELQTRRSLLSYNAGERLYNGQSFSGDRAKVEAQAFLAREHVAIAERKLQALLDHRDRLAVYAPYPGVLQELPRPDGSMVRLGDALAVVENPKAREIWAFLRQDEVLSVGLGDEVKVYLPGLSELRRARVMRIDRTIGFVNEMNSTYIWRAPRDRSAKVILEFSDTAAKPEDDNYRTGMPAVAIFSTRPTNYLIGDMQHRFRMVFGGRQRKSDTGPITTNGGTTTRDKGGPVGDTPGTSDQDRIGPPRNYESTGNALRDPDAVTARRGALVARRPAAPAEQQVPVAADAPAPTPDLLGRVTDSFAGLLDRMRQLLRGDARPPAATTVGVASPVVAAAPPESAGPAGSAPSATRPSTAGSTPPQMAVREAMAQTPAAPVAPASPVPRPDRPPVATVSEPPPPRPPAVGARPAPAMIPNVQLPAPAAAARTAQTRETTGGPRSDSPQGGTARIARVPIAPPPIAAPPAPRPPADVADDPDDHDTEVPAVRRPDAISAVGGNTPGLLARMRERLRVLFTSKPSDDDDWGDEADWADRAEPIRPDSARPSAASPPRAEPPPPDPAVRKPAPARTRGATTAAPGSTARAEMRP